ncbi:MAG: sigma-54-dependent Fis family transcriptional regulator [Acidobacteria bacterium]|nr:sigma-54-dependent Fis family transcriptional regulator [Acidobacteriota bacterium]
MPDPVFADAATRFVRRSEVPVELTGRSPAITRLQELVRRGARLDGGVLITAEAGAAVDDIARELHHRSRAAAGPFIVIDCEAADATSVDRLLFGALEHEQPSDLESVTPDSAIAAARGGTLFLKNVTELRAAAQSQLARIARDGEVRIIDGDVHGQRFRRDLFRRLSATRIDLPPLRDRSDDVAAIAVRVLDDLCTAAGRPPASFSKAALALVGGLTWPGNLAELRLVIERVVAESRGGGVIEIEHLLPVVPLSRASTPFVPAGNLREARLRFERDYIASVLQHHEWRMADAARTLGIQRPNLYRKARQLGIPLTRSSE